MSTNQSTFYGFAAVLIPTLLLGGVIADRWAPAKSTTKDSRGLWLVPSAVILAIFAEITTVAASITGEADTLSRVVVAAAVVGGTAAVGLTVAWPWLRLSGRDIHVLIVVGTLLLSVQGAKLLLSGISLTNSREAQVAFETKLTHLEIVEARLSADARRETAETFKIAADRRAPHRSLAREELKVDESQLRLDEDQTQADAGDLNAPH
jgi:hypothetical protein